MSQTPIVPDAKPSPPQMFLSVGTGIGKSFMARKAILDHCREMPKDHCIVLAVPTHRLAIEHRDELSKILEGSGFKVAVYRGREAEDPNTGEKMCLQHEAALLAATSGADPNKLCRRGKGKKQDKCHHFDSCAYRQQRDITAAVWVITHAVLRTKAPSFFPPVYAVFVDEDPLLEFIGGS